MIYATRSICRRQICKIFDVAILFVWFKLVKTAKSYFGSGSITVQLTGLDSVALDESKQVSCGYSHM